MYFILFFGCKNPDIENNDIAFKTAKLYGSVNVPDDFIHPRILAVYDDYNISVVGEVKGSSWEVFVFPNRKVSIYLF